MPIEVASRVVAIPDQVSCEIADDLAILSLRDGVYYGLNPVGARIWGIVQNPVSVEEVVTTILAEYDIDAAACQADVLRVLNDLSSHGLLELV